MTDTRSYTIDEVEHQTGFDRRTIAYYVQQGLLPKVGRRGPRTRYPRLVVDRLQFIRRVRELQNQGAMGSMTLSDFRELFQRVPAETIAKVVRGDLDPDGLREMVTPRESQLASPDDRMRAMADTLEHLEQGEDERYAAALGSVGRAMDPDGAASATAERTPVFQARTYRSLADTPPSTTPRDTPSGEHHRLTLEAIERTPDAPEPVRLSAPPPPVEDELREALARLHGVVKRQPRAYLRTTETWTRARITEEIVFSARGLDERHLSLLERVARVLRRLIREGDEGANW